MAALLTLAADFIEKVSNPSYGRLINEEYSMKLGQLMNEEGFKDTLRREIETTTDVNTLSSHGWIWLIQWCRINEIKLPAELSLRLVQRWSNVFVQASIIDLATYDTDESNRSLPNTRGPDNDWLIQLIEICTTSPRNEQTESSSEEENVNSLAAENLLIALLQVGSFVAITTAQRLLNEQWPGREKLRRFFWFRFDRLDAQTQEIWLSIISPPERER